MKKTSIIMMMMLLAIVACGSKTGKDVSLADSMANDIDTNLKENNAPQRSDYTFRSEVRTIKEDGEVRWDTIVVYLTDSKGNTEQLYSQAMPLDTMNWSKGDIGEISEDDWNFDGIPDLQVAKGPMNGFGNYTFDVWLWDDHVHKFVSLKCDGEIFDPYVDSDNKCIVTTWRLDDEVEIVRYKWKDGKLVETEREKMSYSDLTDD